MPPDPTDLPRSDAFGAALQDCLDGQYVDGSLLLEAEGQPLRPALAPEWFLRPVDDWDPLDVELIDAVERGPVLDLGAGAGRVALHLQDLGHEVTAVDSSPGAVAVCRERGVLDARLGDVRDLPRERPWATVLLMCGNLGLGGSREGTTFLLRHLAECVVPGGLLIGDSVTPLGDPAVRLRLHYDGRTTAWWDQFNIPADEVPEIVEGSGWMLERHIVHGVEHGVVLRRA